MIQGLQHSALLSNSTAVPTPRVTLEAHKQIPDLYLLLTFPVPLVFSGQPGFLTCPCYRHEEIAGGMDPRVLLSPERDPL